MSGRSGGRSIFGSLEEGYVGRMRSDPRKGGGQHSFDGIITATTPSSRVRTILGPTTPQVGNL